MINYIKFIFIKNLYCKIFNKIIQKKYHQESYEFNFQNILFKDNIYLQKIFLSDKFFSNITADNHNLAYHSFDWLFIAKHMGGGANVLRAKKHIFNWYNIKANNKLPIWNGYLTSKRFINMIYNYDFYAISASQEDKKKIHQIISEHFILISSKIKNKKIKDLTIEQYKALILGSLIYNKNIKKNLKIFLELLKVQIDIGGFHKSYNPLQQAKFLNHLHEIKNMMLFFNLPTPNELSFQIINMSSLLMNLLHKDGSIALFNGSNNFYKKEIDQLIKQERDIKLKDYREYKKGICIYVDKNKKLFMDVVLPTSHEINKNLHASTLAFEFSYYNEKIITNCGSVEKRIGKKPEYLRYSAAHSTIILNNTNISELVEKKSYKRVPKNIPFEINQNENYIIFAASHDGYLNKFNKIIKRKIFISKSHDEIKGEDSIISTKIKNKKISYSIRFHIVPDCNCLITNDKKSIIIKTKLNQTWVFKSSSIVSIENSVYIGDGKKIEENKQIVISGTIDNAKKVQYWSLNKS